MTDSFGMMDGAYFVSKSELLTWVNDLLKLNLTKVEQLGTGAVYSQILDCCYPSEVPLYKVNWKARLEWEFINNFKVLQQSFQKLKINKHVDVEKLIKAKYQDNLEFGQWMKRFYEIRHGKDIKKDYDPVARRGSIEPDFSFVDNKIPTKANLDYHNFSYTADGKRIKTSMGGSISKKVKLNNGDALTHNTKENFKENVDPREFDKIKRERDELREKLSHIERLAMNTQEKGDDVIVKQIKDYLGIIVNKPEPEHENNQDKEEAEDSDNLLAGNEPEESKEVLMLIEGESI